MQSKRARWQAAAEAFGSMRCLTCGQPMTLQAGVLRCGAGHTRDVNRKGYVNALRRAHPSCYDQTLFEARRTVFQAGCYAPVLEALDALLGSDVHTLLDAGCGEGYYLAELLSRHPDWQGAGVDLSREAIEQATDWPCSALWCVADLGALPFPDGAFTAVLDVLTPANYREFQRVLRPGGRLIKVFPGEHYLQEIRQARGMPLYAPGEVGDYLSTHCRLTAEQRVTETFALTPALWRAFVWMTPLNQDLSTAEKESLAQQCPETITVDLHVACGTFAADA